jgi:type I restriction enzyme S subunit
MCPEQAGWFCGTGCFFVETGNAVNPFFLSHLLRSTEYSKTLERLATGATMKNLSNTTLQNLPISLPPRSEQDRLEESFSKLAEETRRLADTYDRKLACLRSLRQSILQRAFSGELTSSPCQAMKEAAE